VPTSTSTSRAYVPCRCIPWSTTMLTGSVLLVRAVNSSLRDRDSVTWSDVGSFVASQKLAMSKRVRRTSALTPHVRNRSSASLSCQSAEKLHSLRFTA
jgi:hypothetical protein